MVRGRDDRKGSLELQAPARALREASRAAFLTLLLCCLQTGCLRQLHSGLFLYQGFLQALAGISPKLAPTLDVLHLDVADLATNIWQQVSFVRSGSFRGLH